MNLFIECLDRSGQQLLGVAGSMLVQGSIVIIALAMVDRLAKERVRAVVRYCLWMLVLLKLVLPPSLSFPSSPAYWLTENPIPKDVWTEIAPRIQGSTAPTIRVYPTFAEKTSLARKFMPPTKLSRSGWAFVLWAAVAVALVAWLIRRSWIVNRLLTQTTSAPASLNSLLEDSAARLGIRRQIMVRLSEEAFSPALCGLFRPVILIPARLVGHLSEAQLRAVLLHELAHFKRGDLWINHAQTLLQIVYWWHPLFWWANSRIRQVREEAVDEAVQVSMAHEADTYPEALITVARLSRQQHSFASGVIGIVELKSTVGQRIRRMLSQPLPSSARIGLAGTVVFIIAALVILPLARPKKEQPRSAPVTVATIKGRSVQAWFDQYDFTSNITFSNQVVALEAIREMGSNAVPFLREKLSAPATGTERQRQRNDPRRKAAWILSQLGSTAEGAVPELIGALDDQIVALYAATALGNLGPKAHAAIPALFASLRRGNGPTGKALVSIAPDHPDLVPTLIGVLHNGNQAGPGQPRINALIALGQLGKKAGPAIPALRDSLEDRDARHFAAQALRRIAPERADVMAEVEAAVKLDNPEFPPISELIVRAQSTDSSERLKAIQELGQAVSVARFKGGSVPKEQIHDQILPLLSELLESQDPSIHNAAASVCRDLGPYAEPLLEHLLRFAEIKGPSIANVIGGGFEIDDPAIGNLIGSLGQIAPGDRRTLPVLVRALDSVLPNVRWNAAAALREFGPDAVVAVPGLQRLLKDNEPWVRFHASISLWNIARLTPSIPLLLERLKADDSDWVPLILCKVFGEMGPSAGEGLPALRELLSHWNPKVREQARAALAKVNPSDPNG